jgi:putative transposase
MPWPERSLVNQRREFIARATADEKPFAELCRDYGISRKTGYKWMERFRASGTAGLVDESRRPKSNSQAVGPEIAAEVVQLKQKHRHWGPKKIWALLARTTPAESMPSRSTVGRILESSGLVVRRRRYRQPSQGLPLRPVVEVVAPNDLWTADFKGWWRTGDGAKCEPLTVRDQYSRFVLELRIMTSTSTVPVQRVFADLFDRYGLPKAIQTDNGPPFASRRALAGLSVLSAWWVSLGIEVVRSRPGKPTDNGGHERMHADMRIDIQDDAARTLRSQQLVCDEWRAEFNHVRPHEALGMRSPAELYRPSSRRPSRVVVGGYPEGCRLLKVSDHGHVKLDGEQVYVTQALRGHRIGLEARSDGFTYVWFFDRVIGRFVVGRDGTVQPVEVLVETVATPSTAPASSGAAPSWEAASSPTP